MTTFRVASFNVRNGRAFDGWNSWPLRRRATAEAIAGLHADVVSLQEVYPFQLRSLRRRLHRYEVAGAGRTDGRRGEWCAVLVDPQHARLVEHRARWFGDAPDQPGARAPGARFPRLATTAVVDVEGVGAVDVVCTHLDTRSEPRAASVTQLATWLDPSRPQVVVGDFNARLDDPALEPLWRAGFRSALPDDAGGTNHDFSGRLDGRQIDHILVSEHLDVVRGEVCHPRPRGRLPSDHWPVVADLRLRPTVDS